MRIVFSDAGNGQQHIVQDTTSKRDRGFAPHIHSKSGDSNHSLASVRSPVSSCGMELSASTTSQSPDCEIDVECNSVRGASAQGSNESLQAVTVPATDATMTVSLVAAPNGCTASFGSTQRPAPPAGANLSVASSSDARTDFGDRGGAAEAGARSVGTPDDANSGHTFLSKLMVKLKPKAANNSGTRIGGSQTTGQIINQLKTASTGAKARGKGRRFSFSGTLRPFSAPIPKQSRAELERQPRQAKPVRKPKAPGKPPKHPNWFRGITKLTIRSRKPTAQASNSCTPSPRPAEVPPRQQEASSSSSQRPPVQDPRQSAFIPPENVLASGSPPPAGIVEIYRNPPKAQLVKQQHDRIRTCNSQLTSSSYSADASDTMRGIRHVSPPPCNISSATAPRRSALSHAPPAFSSSENHSMLPSPRRDRQAPSAYPIARCRSGIAMPSPRGNSGEPSSVREGTARGDDANPHPSIILPHVRTTQSGVVGTGISGASPRTPSRIPSPRSSQHSSPRRGNSFGDAESLEILRQKEKGTAAERALLQARLTSLPGMPSHLKARIWEDSSEPKFNPTFTRQQVRFSILRSFFLSCEVSCL